MDCPARPAELWHLNHILHYITLHLIGDLSHWHAMSLLLLIPFVDKLSGTGVVVVLVLHVVIVVVVV